MKVNKNNLYILFNLLTIHFFSYETNKFIKKKLKKKLLNKYYRNIKFFIGDINHFFKFSEFSGNKPATAFYGLFPQEIKYFVSKFVQHQNQK